LCNKLRQSLGVGLDALLYFTTSPIFITVASGNYFHLLDWTPHGIINIISEPCNLHIPEAQLLAPCIEDNPDTQTNESRIYDQIAHEWQHEPSFSDILQPHAIQRYIKQPK
jgi:hypothetical protein